jgi:hypothetical protein
METLMRALFFILALTAFGPLCSPAQAANTLAERIHEVSINGRKHITKYRDAKGNKIYQLYGKDIGDAQTKYGKLSCARVVSILLQEAGAGIGWYDGVGAMERAFKRRGWKEVGFADLDHGDIIVWNSRFYPSSTGACTGNGDCHIGVYVGWGLAYDNDGKFGYPIMYPVRRIGVKFKTAYRPQYPQ